MTTYYIRTGAKVTNCTANVRVTNGSGTGYLDKNTGPTRPEPGQYGTGVAEADEAKGAANPLIGKSSPAAWWEIWFSADPGFSAFVSSSGWNPEQG